MNHHNNHVWGRQAVGKVSGWRSVWCVLVLVFSLTACSRSYVVVPDMTSEITTARGEPITNARMHLERLDWRDDLVVNEAVFTTDDSGRIELDEQLEREGSYPLIMNGVPDYYFLLCFEADGYNTVTNRLSDVGPGDNINVILPLNILPLDVHTTMTCDEIPEPFDNRDEAISTQVREDVEVTIRGRASFRFFVEWFRQ
ncbi:MAG: hypothetical protein AAF708_10295 [Deinococcota bacterium]